ncbi:DNA repair protein rad14 [Coemansia erecta]|uniref:DNA repair protein rad14 n=1 Tax=Coemansia erecta TaxID=147472 RepID=A0A9W7Y770_9FUNG|nr:DNA repair protein rad14 [Coemansia erecta]
MGGGDLTEAQKQTIESNRQRALNKRKQQQQQEPDQQAAAPQAAATKPRGSSRLTSNYYEYNLSTMRDTRGGYLVAEDSSTLAGAMGREALRRRGQKQTDSSEQLRAESTECSECRAVVGVDAAYLREYSVAVCAKCIGEVAEKYSLLTKTEAKEDYLLTDSELSDRELFPVWEKANPHKSTWNNMLLFLRMHVETFAVAKWGSLEALDDEFERRTDAKRARKEKKYLQSVAELRRRTRVEEWERGRRERLKLEAAHEHRFEGGGSDGATQQRCVECGLEIECEELEF